MIYILEGVDRVGKTTFSKFLEERYGAQRLDLMRPFKEGWNKSEQERLRSFSFGTAAMLAATAPYLSCDVVVDRLFHSGVVYGDLFGGANLPLDEIEDAFKEKAVLLYCFCDKKLLSRRWNDSGYDNVDDIERISSKYEEILSTTKLPFWRIDTEEYPVEFLDRIFSFES